MKNYLLAFVALLVVTPLACVADNFDYTYLDAGLTSAKHDSLSGGNGLGVRGSLRFGTRYFGYAAYDEHRFDHTSTAYGWEFVHFGAGMHAGLTDNLDFVAFLGAVSATTTYRGYGLSLADHGYEAGAGLRAKLSDSLELDADIRHDTVALQWNTYTVACSPPYCTSALGTAVGTDHAENVVSAGLEYALSHHFGLGLDYSRSNFQGMQVWKLSGRWNF
ncbi:MAG TPA: hypothetical protein VF117_07840 [Gammaproteobacteria bacterium]